MTEITNAYDWNGRTIIGSDGHKIGKVDELYLIDRATSLSGRACALGFLGTKRSLVPLAGASPKGEDVRCVFPRSRSKTRPASSPTASSASSEEIGTFEY